MLEREQVRTTTTRWNKLHSVRSHFIATIENILKLLANRTSFSVHFHEKEKEKIGLKHFTANPSVWHKQSDKENGFLCMSLKMVTYK